MAFRRLFVIILGNVSECMMLVKLFCRNVCISRKEYIDLLHVNDSYGERVGVGDRTYTL